MGVRLFCGTHGENWRELNLTCELSLPIQLRAAGVLGSGEDLGGFGSRFYCAGCEDLMHLVEVGDELLAPLMGFGKKAFGGVGELFFDFAVAESATAVFGSQFRTICFFGE